jgi:hypothetical protein
MIIMFHLCISLNHSKYMPNQKKTKIAGNFSMMGF